MTTSITKYSLLDELKDKETRDLYVEEHIATGLPFQIHALREKLGLTQSELAKRAGMAQERISKLEDPNYEFIPKINTLIKLANVFDVPLIVKFGTWYEFFGWETDLSPAKLAPLNFEEEEESLRRAAMSTTVTVQAVWGGGVFDNWPDWDRQNQKIEDDFITLSSRVIRLKVDETLGPFDPVQTAISSQSVEELLSEIPPAMLQVSNTQSFEWTN